MKFIFNNGIYIIHLFNDGVEDNIIIETNPDGLGIALHLDESGRVIMGIPIEEYFNPIVSLRIAENIQVLPDGTVFSTYGDVTYKVEVIA